MALPRVKKQGPNKGLWGTRDQLVAAWRAALDFGPVDVLTADAIKSGGPFPGTYRSWDGMQWRREKKD